MFVVVGELGLEVVGAAGQHAFGRLLQRGEELVLLARSGAVAADHVVRLIDWRRNEMRGGGRFENVYT